MRELCRSTSTRRVASQLWALTIPGALSCSSSFKEDDRVDRSESGAGGPADSGDSVDSGGGTSDEPATRPDAYRVVELEHLVNAASVRSSAVVWSGEQWVSVYTAVTDYHRIYASAVVATESGMTVEAPVLVADGAYGSFEPEIAASDAGDLLAVYEDDRVGFGTCCREIYARTISAAGQPTEQSFNLTNQPSVEEYQPSVGWDSDVWFVAWSDDREYAGDDRRLLYGRAVGKDGELGSEIRIGGESLWQVYSSVSGSGGAGRFLVVWGDYDPVDGSLDCGYRARLVDTQGNLVGEPIEIARIGNQVYDRPSVAWNPWREAWLVVWMRPYTIEGTWIFLDGRVEHLGTLVDEEVGSGAAKLTYSGTTNSFLLAWHAWWSYDGFVSTLDADGLVVGEKLPINLTTPPLGTFWVPIAANDAGEALATPSLDYARITGSLYRADP